jgi:hypothetical protein
MAKASDHEHEHGHEHGHGKPHEHGHGHGDPYVWKPGESKRRAALWVVGGGAGLIVLGLVLRWIADTYFA